MKNSYKIIILLGIILIIALGALGIYQLNLEHNLKTESEATPTPASNQTEQDTRIMPFTSIIEYDGELYVTQSTAESADVLDAHTLPVRSELFTIIDERIYYVTEGGEYAPELRMCAMDGSDDISVTEFISPYGSPAVIGNSIYTAYYGTGIESENTGLYRISISSQSSENEPTYEKLADGEFYIYGYDDKYIYYTTNDGSSGTILYRVTLNGVNQTEVLNYNIRSNNIIIDKNFIFFSAYDDISHCFKIYRSPKNGRGNIDAYAYECFTGDFDVIDNRLYYQAASSIYSCELSGSDEIVLADLEEDSAGASGFLKFGDIMYFSERFKNSEKQCLFRLDTSTGEKQNISK